MRPSEIKDCAEKYGLPEITTEMALAAIDRLKTYCNGIPKEDEFIKIEIIAQISINTPDSKKCKWTFEEEFDWYGQRYSTACGEDYSFDSNTYGNDLNFCCYCSRILNLEMKE